jgi:hypothetical protein
MQNQNNNNQKKLDRKSEEDELEKTSTYITMLYIILAIVAVIVMIIAAYITYGYQPNEIIVSFHKVTQKMKEKNTNKSNNMTVGVDLSEVPSDKVVEDILNDTMPNVCDDCDEDPLDCLKDYKINKILVQEQEYQNYLIIELITGHDEQSVFRVVIDLSNNNEIVRVEGNIDDGKCRDIVEEESVEGDEIFLDKGSDPKESHYIKVTPKPKE